MPSAPDDLFEKFLALGYVSPDDLKEMKERSSALGIPLAEAALLADRLHPDARAWILSESLGIPYLEVESDTIPLDLAHLFPDRGEAVAADRGGSLLRRGMVTYEDVAPFFR